MYLQTNLSPKNMIDILKCPNNYKDTDKLYPGKTLSVKETNSLIKSLENIEKSLKENETIELILKKIRNNEDIVAETEIVKSQPIKELCSFFKVQQSTVNETYRSVTGKSFPVRLNFWKRLQVLVKTLMEENSKAQKSMRQIEKRNKELQKNIEDKKKLEMNHHNLTKEFKCLKEEKEQQSEKVIYLESKSDELSKYEGIEKKLKDSIWYLRKGSFHSFSTFKNLSHYSLTYEILADVEQDYRDLSETINELTRFCMNKYHQLLKANTLVEKVSELGGIIKASIQRMMNIQNGKPMDLEPSFQNLEETISKRKIEKKQTSSPCCEDKSETRLGQRQGQRQRQRQRSLQRQTMIDSLKRNNDELLKSVSKKEQTQQRQKNEIDMYISRNLALSDELSFKEQEIRQLKETNHKLNIKIENDVQTVIEERQRAIEKERWKVNQEAENLKKINKALISQIDELKANYKKKEDIAALKEQQNGNLIQKNEFFMQNNKTLQNQKEQHKIMISKMKQQVIEIFHRIGKTINNDQFESICFEIDDFVIRSLQSSKELDRVKKELQVRDQQVEEIKRMLIDMKGEAITLKVQDLLTKLDSLHLFIDVGVKEIYEYLDAMSGSHQVSDQDFKREQKDLKKMHESMMWRCRKIQAELKNKITDSSQCIRCPEDHEFVYGEIERYRNVRILRCQLLFRKDRHPQKFRREIILRVPHLLIIIRTKDGLVIAGYSSRSYSHSHDEEESFGLVVFPEPRKSFPLKKGKVAMKKEEPMIIMGNDEFVIDDAGDNIKFEIHETSSFFQRTNQLKEFVGKWSDISKIESLQIYRIKFEIENIKEVKEKRQSTRDYRSPAPSQQKLTMQDLKQKNNELLNEVIELRKYKKNIIAKQNEKGADGKQIKAQQEKNQQYQELIKKKENENNEIMKKVAKLKEETNFSQMIIDKLKSENGSLNQRVKELSDQLLLKENEDKKRQVERNQNEGHISTLNMKQEEKLKQKQVEKEIFLNNEMKRITNQLRNVQEKEKENKQKILSLEEQRSQIKKGLEELGLKCDRIQKEKVQIEKENLKLQQENRKMIEEKSEKEKKIENSQPNSSDLKDEIDGMKREKESLEKELKQMKEDISENNNYYDEKQRQFEKLEEKIQVAKAQILSLQQKSKRIDEIEKQLKEKELERSQVAQKYEQDTKRYIELKQELTAIQKEALSKKKSIEILENQFNGQKLMVRTKSKEKERSQLYPPFFVGQAIGEVYERQYLIEEIEKVSLKRIEKCKLLYSFPLMQNNFHTCVDDRPFFVIIMKLINGNVLAFYSEVALSLSNVGLSKKGFLSSLTNKKTFFLNTSKEANNLFSYDSYYFIIGSTDLRLELHKSDSPVASSFGSRFSVFDLDQDDNKMILLGNDKEENYLECYEVFQVFMQ